MPYIKQNDRDKLVSIATQMAVVKIKANGDLNFLLYYYAKYFIEHNYNSLKNFCGELRQCATEIERRILGPYEDKKIDENGDV